MEDKISVIIPVYNVEPYLERCLDSIVQNTYRNLEIICVDDGSPDNCGAILDRYAERDDRFVVIHKENGGVSSARNRGLDVATGEFIAFIDPDDWVHPQYFEILRYLQKRENCELVVCEFERLENPELYVKYDPSKIKGESYDLAGLYRNHKAKGYVWRKLYSKTLVNDNKYVDGMQFAEDAAFNGLLFSKKEDVKAYYTTIPLYFYYDRPGSLVYEHNEKQVLMLGEKVLAYTENAVGEVSKFVLVQDIIKRLLVKRYMLMVQGREEDVVVQSNFLLRKAVKQLCKLDIPIRKKLMYAFFAYFPCGYRLFRIINDPTMIKAERKWKEQGAAENGQ